MNSEVLDALSFNNNFLDEKGQFPCGCFERKKKQNAVITMLGGFDFKTENLLPTNGVINDMFGWVEKK